MDAVFQDVHMTLSPHRSAGFPDGAHLRTCLICDGLSTTTGKARPGAITAIAPVRRLSSVSDRDVLECVTCHTKADLGRQSEAHFHAGGSLGRGVCVDGCGCGCGQCSRSALRSHPPKTSDVYNRPVTYELIYFLSSYY